MMFHIVDGGNRFLVVCRGIRKEGATREFFQRDFLICCNFGELRGE